VANALSRSVKVIQLTVVSTCETDVRERLKNSQEIDAFFETVIIVLRTRAHKDEVQRISIVK